MIIEQGIAKIIATETIKYLEKRKMQPILVQYITKDLKTVVVPDFTMELSYAENFNILCHLFIRFKDEQRIRLKFGIAGEHISWWNLHQNLLIEMDML